MELTIRNDRIEIPVAHKALDQFVVHNQIGTRIAADLHVALEEHLTNIVAYGYPQGAAGKITVQFETESNEIRMHILDDGKPFSPVDAPDVDVTRPMDERPIGGLGIHLMRRLMDRMDYERNDGRNHLTMTKAMRPVRE